MTTSKHHALIAPQQQTESQAPSLPLIVAIASVPTMMMGRLHHAFYATSLAHNATAQEIPNALSVAPQLELSPLRSSAHAISDTMKFIRLIAQVRVLKILIRLPFFMQ
jgi:2-methylaconitate cis-trans-isomerase PrpF